jgi:hypothetical protein
MARKNAVFKKSVVGEGLAAIITWTPVEAGIEAVVCDLAKIPAVTQGALVVHGASAKVGDGGALQDATTAEKADSMRKIVAALYAGEWRGERESGDATLLDAICEFNPKKSREAHATELKSLSTAEKLQLRTIPEIKKIYDRMISETVKKSGAKAEDLLKKFQDLAAK